MAWWLAVVAGYAALSEIGFRLALPPAHVAVFWPAAGLAAGLVVARSAKRWLSVLSAVATANVLGNLAHGKPFFGVTLVFLVGNLAEPVLVAVVVRGQHPRTRLQFLRAGLVAALAAPAVTGLLVATALDRRGGNWVATYRSWVAGDALGIALVAPLLSPRSAVRSMLASRREAALGAVAVIVAVVATLGLGAPRDAVWQVYLVAPVLAYVASRFSFRCVSAALLVVGTVAVWCAAHGIGPLAASGGDRLARVGVVQLLLALFIVPTYALSDLIQGSRTTTARLRLADRRFRAGVASSPIGIVVRDHEGRALVVNDAYADILGRPAHEVIGMHWRDFTAPEAIQAEQARLDVAAERGDDAVAFDKTFVRPDGGVRHASVSIALIRDDDGRVVQQLVHAIDVTDEVSARAALLRRALHDPLTGLLNRDGFTHQATELLEAPGADRHVALLVIDLDGFKPINDAHGHLVGDAVLTAIAGRLRGNVHASDLVARVGGDEFFVALTVRDECEARAVAQRLASAIAQPIRLSDSADAHHVSASIGVAVDGKQDEQCTLAQLTRLSDEAMYRAKRTGLGLVEVATRA